MIILFDLDGTLIDSTEAILESFHHSLAMHHFPSQKDQEIKALIGYPLDIMYGNLGIDKAHTDALIATYKERYRDISREKTKLLENAREAVLLAKEFATLGIVTTKTGYYSRVLMEYFGLMEHFDVLVGREDVTHPKPHAEPILKALQQLEHTNKEVWMIGDTKLDLLAAKSANVNAMGVLSGYGTHDSLKELSDMIFDDALEAMRYLQVRKK